jgi:hypothetical protein
MLGTKDKEMIWVENTTHRFRMATTNFGRYPERVFAFFEKHMGKREQKQGLAA